MKLNRENRMKRSILQCQFQVNLYESNEISHMYWDDNRSTYKYLCLYNSLYLLHNRVLDILAGMSTHPVPCNYHHSYTLDNKALCYNEVVLDNRPDKDQD